jgi:PleD family two-component response regulator/predicted RNA-binding Zn-ribbon protein involved in translation (DUF1610 family)
MSDKKTKLLIIDDDEPVRSMYAEVFKKEGFEVEEAIDGLDGLEKASVNAPDIIFTGIIMPRMDGFQLKEALSKNVATANVPVVMSSHMGRKDDQDRAKEAGIKDFIVLDMVPPRQAVERVRAVLGGGEYKIKINPIELDATKLATDLHFNSDFKCKYCGADLLLTLKIDDLERREFGAVFICPNCGK